MTVTQQIQMEIHKKSTPSPSYLLFFLFCSRTIPFSEWKTLQMMRFTSNMQKIPHHDNRAKIINVNSLAFLFRFSVPMLIFVPSFTFIPYPTLKHSEKIVTEYKAVALTIIVICFFNEHRCSQYLIYSLPQSALLCALWYFKSV